MSGRKRVAYPELGFSGPYILPEEPIINRLGVLGVTIPPKPGVIEGCFRDFPTGEP